MDEDPYSLVESGNGLQTTGVVFLFVFTMAMFLWGVDVTLLWITQKLLGTGG